MLRRSTFLPNAGVLAVLVLAAGGGQQASIKILGLTFGGMTESGHPAPIFGGLVEVVLFLGCCMRATRHHPRSLPIASQYLS